MHTSRQFYPMSFKINGSALKSNKNCMIFLLSNLEARCKADPLELTSLIRISEFCKSNFKILI